jgi:hypothetical protein
LTAGFIVANPLTSEAAVMDASANKGTLKDHTMEEAEERFWAGRASVGIAYLLFSKVMMRFVKVKEEGTT